MKFQRFSLWLSLWVYEASAFAPPQSRSAAHQHALNRPIQQQLSFFRRNNDDKESTDDKPNSEDDKDSNKSSRVPFFARWGKSAADSKSDSSDTVVATTEESPVSDAIPSVAVAVVEAPTPSPPPSPPVIVEDSRPKYTPPVDETLTMSPVEKAQYLKAQAEKARLEAERMDAELTLQKITRLEREIEHAKAKDKDIDDLQRDMDALRAKLRGEAPKPVMAVKPTTSAATSTYKKSLTTTPTTSSSSSSSTISKRIDDNEPRYSTMATPVPEPENEATLREMEHVVREAPDFIKAGLAAQVGLEVLGADPMNATEIAIRLEKLRRLDYSYAANLTRPSFTMAEIEDKKQELQKGWVKKFLPDALTAAANGNETELALLALEYEFFSLGAGQENFEKWATTVDDDQLLMMIFNKTAIDGSIETLYPKCTRKEGQVPTEAQVQRLITDVLPKASFSTSSKPEAVAGGYIIRGVSRAKNGDDLIEKIEQQLVKSSLKDKMTVLYTNDFTVFSEFDEEPLMLDDQPPILYVTGPDIVREPRRVLLSITTALGLATTWYLSVYPFLLNPAISKRVDEQLALADAGMNPDLTWLTDLTFPLFITFIGIQLMHEVGHRIVASSKGVRIIQMPCHVY
jgi:hypothetical protein